MALTYETRVMQELAKLLHERIEQVRDKLAGGQLASMEEYKFHAGQIVAFTQVLDDLLEMAEKSANTI